MQTRLLMTLLVASVLNTITATTSQHDGTTTTDQAGASRSSTAAMPGTEQFKDNTLIIQSEIHIRVSNAGIEAIVSAIEKRLQNELRGFPLPDVYAVTKNGQIEAMGIQVSSYDPSNDIAHEALSNDTVVWTINGATINITGHFVGSSMTLIGPTGSIGHFTALIRMRKIRFNIELSPTQKRHVNAAISHCVMVTDSPISVQMDTPPIYSVQMIQYYKNILSDRLQAMTYSIVCKKLESFTSTVIKERLNVLRRRIQIGKYIFIDVGSVSDATATDDFIGIQHHVTITDSEAMKLTRARADPPPFPHQANNVELSTDQMISILISEDVLNAILLIAHNDQWFTFEINKSSLTDRFESLKTTCGLFDLCIGAAFDNIARHYPDSYARILLKSKEAPLILIGSWYITLMVEAELMLFIDEADNATNHILTADAGMLVNIDLVTTSNGTIEVISHIIDIVLYITQATFDVKTIGESNLQEFRDILKPYLDTFLNESIPNIQLFQKALPLTNFTTRTHDGVIEISADFINYK